jgi:hypothetical protein
MPLLFDYTVVFLHIDTEQVIVEHVEATGPADAVERAGWEWAEHDNDGRMGKAEMADAIEYLRPLCVFAGRRFDVMEGAAAKDALMPGALLGYE